MSNQKDTGERQQTIIVFLLFIVLILASINVGTFNKINLLEKIPVTKAPDIESIGTAAPVRNGKIAIIIDDFGYRNDTVSDGFLNMGADLTYAVIPGHEYSQTMSKKAFQLGYEVIVHIPMGTTALNYGEEEYIIKASMTSAEIESRIDKVLQHLPEAVGMNNHQGSKASASKRVMNVMGTVLKENGKYFLAPGEFLVLGNNADENSISQQLYILAEKAKTSGFAVGIGHVKENTLNVLQREIPKLKADNFEFVFVSEVVN